MPQQALEGNSEVTVIFPNQFEKKHKVFNVVSTVILYVTCETPSSLLALIFCVLVLNFSLSGLWYPI